MKSRILIAWLMLMAFVSVVHAQEGYAVLEDGILTLYYDSQRSTRTGATFNLESNGVPGWMLRRNEVRSVVFDMSFQDARPTTCAYWFCAMPNLVSIANMVFLNTSEVTDMTSMFSSSSQISSLYLGGFDTSKVTSMLSMFQGCTNLSEIEGLEKFNTGNVTSMSSMFRDCSSLTSLDVSSFNTEKATSMLYMFSGCTSLRTLDLSSFTFSSYNTPSHFLEGCSSLKALTIPATATKFDNNSCTGVGTESKPCMLFNPSGATLEKTEEGDGWFVWKGGYFKDVQSEPYALYDGSTLSFHYDDQRYLRPGVSYDVMDDFPEWLNDWGLVNNTTAVVFDPSFQAARPISCSYWFCAMSQLGSITGLEYLNTSQVTDMSSMFSGASLLSSVDVSHFDTSNVTSMLSMFQDCTNLTSIAGLENFNTENVTSMSSMFRDCSSLTSVDVSHFNTEKAISIAFVFNNCSSLSSLDLGSFTFTQDSYTEGLMMGCTSLTSLTIPATAGNLDSDACSGVGTQDAPCTLFIPHGFTPEKTDEGDGWFEWKSGCFTIGYKARPYAFFRNGTLTFYCDTERYTRTGYTFDLNTNEIPGWHKYNNYLTAVVFDPSFANATPTSCYYWFYDLPNLLSITGMEYLNTSNVVTMAGMFSKCSSLSSIDVSYFDTSKVKNMNYMFRECTSLNRLDLSNFNTENVKTMTGMFHSCTKLAFVDVSHFNTENVTDMQYMFYYCSKLTSLDVSHFNTKKVQSMQKMFYKCIFLPSLDISGFTITQDCNTTEMLSGCNRVETLYIPIAANTNFSSDACLGVGSTSSPCLLIHPADFTPPSGPSTFSWKGGYFTSKGEPYAVLNGTTLTFYCDKLKRNREGTVYALNEGSTSPGWYDNRANVFQVVFNASFQYAFPLSCNSWFSGMRNLTSISGMEYLKTSLVSDMGAMFNSCVMLTDLDLSGFNTRNVTNMESLFNNCSGLTALDVSHFNTEKVTTMDYLFAGCKSLTELDLSNFDTENVTNMQSLFAGCTGLTSLDVSHFKTDNVDNMAAMFSLCSSLTSLDVSHFNTEKATAMYGMFNECSGLESLDISNFVIPDSTLYFGYSNMQMFQKCTNLKTLAIPVSASNLKNDACMGVGTEGSPCELVYPDNFSLDKTGEGDGWFRWKSGYFKDAVRFLLGDVNHDGAVNVTDVTLLVNYLLGYPQPIFFIENADVNEDHDINITDVTSLVNLVLNAQTPTQGF